jgi:hypothetical protein
MKLFSIAVLLAGVVAIPAASGDLISLMESEHYDLCGGPPEPTCSQTYWLNAASQLANLAASYQEFFNDPIVAMWCGHYPAECQPILDDYYEVLQAWDYAIGQLS